MVVLYAEGEQGGWEAARREGPDVVVVQVEPEQLPEGGEEVRRHLRDVVEPHKQGVEGQRQVGVVDPLQLGDLVPGKIK